MHKYNQEFFTQLPFTFLNDPIVAIKLDGYSLQVPKSFKAASEELIKNVTGGCGPGGLGDRVVPDTMWLLKVTAACKIHDWTFQVWNDDQSFIIANDLFLQNLKAIIHQHGGWKWLQKVRKVRAKTYYWAVSGSKGKKAYLDNHLKYLTD